MFFLEGVFLLPPHLFEKLLLELSESLPSMSLLHPGFSETLQELWPGRVCTTQTWQLIPRVL